MTDLEGMHSYFWLTSSRLREPLQDDVPYTAQALRQDLAPGAKRLGGCQSHRERDAIYSYLTAVFDLVVWWAAEDWALAGHARRYGCRRSGRPTRRTVCRDYLLHLRSSKS